MNQFVLALMLVGFSGQLCSGVSFREFCGKGSCLNVEELLERSLNYQPKELKDAAEEIEKHIHANTIRKITSSIRLFVNSEKKHVRSTPTLGGPSAASVVVVGQLLLALGETLEVEKPECAENDYFLVQKVGPFSSWTALRTYISHYRAVYADKCFSVHKRNLDLRTIPEDDYNHVSMLMSNIIGQQLDKYTGSGLLQALKDIEWPLGEKDMALGKALYTTLLELGGQVAQEKLSSGDGSAIKDQMSEHLAEPCRRVINSLGDTGVLLSYDIDIKPELVDSLTDKELRKIGLGLACRGFWMDMNRTYPSLSLYLKSLKSTAA